MSEELTPEQIENWRNVIFRMIGPYAFYMPKEDVQKFRDMLQARINTISQEAGEPIIQFCECDPSRQGKTVHASGKVTCNKCRKERREG